jgi:hypothetical protein
MLLQTVTAPPAGAEDEAEPVSDALAVADGLVEPASLLDELGLDRHADDISVVAPTATMVKRVFPRIKCSFALSMKAHPRGSAADLPLAPAVSTTTARP